jgi:replicative DNA helicase
MKETTAHPHSQESEMVILGAMLNDSESCKLSAETLSESDFYLKHHQIVFRMITTLHHENQIIDIYILGEKLKDNPLFKEMGGVGYLATLSQYAGSAFHIEEYIHILKGKKTLRRLLDIIELIKQQTLISEKNPEEILKILRDEIDKVSSEVLSKFPLVLMKDRLDSLEKKLGQYRGQKYLGLCQKTLQEIDENLLGLRKFILLAAAPNVGKTAMTIQWGLDVLKNHEEACLVYFSLEMAAPDILIRMLCNLSGMNYQTFVLGSGNQERQSDPSAHFDASELDRIHLARKTMEAFGDRLQIIDSSQSHYLDAQLAISIIHQLKERTGAKRVIVIIDYLQVWPLQQHQKFSNEIEADKWRIGEIKKIRDAINDDPIIVISEARKPSPSEETWGSDLSDVMGSARGTYTPDVVMLFSQVSPKALKKLWLSKKLPEITSTEGHEEILDENEKRGEAIVSFLASHGISICKLKIPKCRDAMKRFTLLVSFHFRKNIFKPINWAEIHHLVTTIKKTQKSNARTD